MYRYLQVEHLRFLFALPPLRYILPEQTGWTKQKEVACWAVWP